MTQRSSGIKAFMKMVTTNGVGAGAGGGPPSTALFSAVVAELRTLFIQGDFATCAARAEQLLHRHRDLGDRALVTAARAAALILLGRPEVAHPLVVDLASAEDSVVAPFARYAGPYIAWATNAGVADALDRIADCPALEAQLLYRLGRYDDAAEKYRRLYDGATPAAPVRTWSLASRLTGGKTQVSSAEAESVKQTQCELATNLMASLVLAGRGKEALALKNEVDGGYEIEYNAGCAAVAEKDWAGAERAIADAERLFREGMDAETDKARGLSPILVQRAYVGHVAGNVVEAEKEYAKVVRERCADAASLAVAANNAAVAKGQLALAKQQMVVRQQGQQSADDARALVRERNAVLFDALKKMKATSGWDVERKLTFQQRRAMGRNRAVLLVQMGRLAVCREELDKFKRVFPDDDFLPLVEAALVAKAKSPDEADALLRDCAGSDTNVVHAARVRLAMEGGKPAVAANLLSELFPGRAAALATAATVLEAGGLVDDAIELLRGVAKDNPKFAIDAKRALSATLMRAEKYEQAAKVLKEVLAKDVTDELALGQLVVATSYFDPSEAEKLSERLPSLSTPDGQVDVEALESRPPPRRRDIRAAQSAEVSGAAVVGDSADSSGASIKKKKKKKKRLLPKNFDPDGPLPDPERWLPKTQRSSYKKKKKNRDGNNFRGAQGADAASADAAGVRNAERSAARAADSSMPAPSSQVPKGTKGKKKNRRR